MMDNFTPCPEWQTLLSAYHDHQLGAAERAKVRRHLDACAACRAALAQLDADRQRFLTVYPITSPAALRESVMKEITTMQTPTTRTIPSGWLRWAFGLALIAVIGGLALLGAVLLTSPRTPEQVAQAPTEVTIGGEGYNVYSHPMAMHRAAESARKSPDSVIQDADALASTPPSAAAEPFNFNQGNPRNYGIPGGVQMGYDVDLRLEVKDALRDARAAQELVRGHGGFIIDFNYDAPDGERPRATLSGKVPADQAQATLTTLEKYGQVRGLTIAGEDLTEQMQRERDEARRQQEKANKMGAIANKAHPWPAISATDERHWAQTQADAAKRALLGLQAKHDLVAFTAVFQEANVRKPLHLTDLNTALLHVLSFALLLLGILAVVLLGLGLLATPVLLARMAKKAASSEISKE